MSACRRDTLGDSYTIVLAVVRAMAPQSVFCEGELLPNSANRYNVAELTLLRLTFFRS